ncbi:Putative oxidoreductase C terminal domain-containing protein [Mariniphaga anaerophila]|uniref:Putative oxidoreductase C terminal domain-containing protein n=1 Tax=Mariniphaga anaerophila TaxID=1484053 RepID=A0A1M5DFA7_9BACT|nr:putative oxidoreductase C-terminal domain-containing protein [Mariniphaga anaerophila]SHF65659.1 Putative oxidoreductase C terminal domain-containing protein [Mariniphaga anaerophila]
MSRISISMLVLTVMLSACSGGGQKSETQESKDMFTGAKGEVKLMTLDPGHFHAALVQKSMYDQIDPTVHIYAPEGPELQAHLNLINSFNNRAENPTSWKSEVYTGPDYLEKMLADKPGNVMVTAGNNAKKADYILKTIDAGINVLADKPMIILPEEFPVLEKAFKIADEKGVLLYDIMTERYEITTMIQRELSMMPEVFGTLEVGTPENPAITKESVHHFFKYVSGSPLQRPAWFFDVNQQGEGIVDVTTHLVDMIQWEAFPEVTLKKEDVEITSASRWATELTPEMFKKSTKLDEYPDFLKKDVENDILKVYANGEINYTLKGVHAKVSVIWNFEAPEGTGDTHYSIMRGTNCNLIIKQGADEGYKPTLYVEPVAGTNAEAFAAVLDKAVNKDLQAKHPGLELKKLKDDLWMVNIPEKYKVGHEAHFGQVTKKYLEFLVKGEMPEWEVPNMIVKYYTTTEGLKAAMK